MRLRATSVSTRIEAAPGATGAGETNLMEKPDGGSLTINGDRVTVSVRPYEIVSVRVDYPKPSAALPESSFNAGLRRNAVASGRSPESPQDVGR